MMALPRLALAVPGLGPEPSPASLGLLAGLSSMRWRVQHFRSRACPTGTEAVHQATGLPGRHLDAWLMPPDVIRRVFARGALGSDLALIEGTLEEPTTILSREYQDRPGGLRPIARALDLPTVALLSCPRWEGLHLADLPDGIDAILLDGLEDPDDYARIAPAVRMMTRKPVIGAVEALPEVRESLAKVPRNDPLPGELIGALARSFLKFADMPAIRALAHCRSFPSELDEPGPRDWPRFRVAYAQDEAFGGYFPDTLETLEALGADLVEFSPLRSEALPEAVDLVMIGCGLPDQFADALAANLSLINALRCHVYRGRRIYSEGGGTAYLGRTMKIEGREVAGAGILPIDSELRVDPILFDAVTCTLRCDTWLAPRGSEVRGYQSNRWHLRPTSELCHCAAGFGPLSDVGNFFYHHHAVGSLVHLHLAALPQVVAAFAGPHRPSLTLRQGGR
jgi:cobyrinic acid a,c-diamide synthase